jgi:hypothetical protein
MHAHRIVACLGLVTLLACPLSAEEKPAEQLTVRIVPTGLSEAGGRAITLFGSGQHFHVVLTNTGKTPVRLWKEWCSWGYFNLAFQVRSDDGKVTTTKKKPREWGKNFPDSTIIPPGDHMVIDVSFDTSAWQDAPLPPAGQQRTVSMRAVFEITADADTKKHKVWTGRVSSDENRYTIFH